MTQPDLGIAGEWDEWYGLPRFRFEVEGYRAFLLPPAAETPGRPRPWVWYSPTFLGPNPAHPEHNPGRLAHPAQENSWHYARLTAGGLWGAGVEIGESYGSPAGREAQTCFHRFLTTRLGFAQQACLLPQSRGGLMLYNWGVEHPECVRCVAAIYPVTDLRTWPGEAQFADAAAAYGLSVPEWTRGRGANSPVERLAPLAAARVPVFHVHGDSDTVVPCEPNTLEFARRYRAAGGEIEVLVVPGGKHDRSPAFFENARLCEFLLEHGW